MLVPNASVSGKGKDYVHFLQLCLLVLSIDLRPSFLLEWCSSLWTLVSKTKTIWIDDQRGLLTHLNSSSDSTSLSWCVLLDYNGRQTSLHPNLGWSRDVIRRRHTDLVVCIQESSAMHMLLLFFWHKKLSSNFLQTFCNDVIEYIDQTVTASNSL